MEQFFRYLQPILIFSLIFISFGFKLNHKPWQSSRGQAALHDAQIVTVDPHDPNIIYVGTKSGVYKSINKGKDYSLSFRLPGESQAIHMIHLGRHQANHIYLATTDGLYESQNAGKTWEKIYSSTNPDASQVLSVLPYKDQLLIGTKAGLLFQTVNQNIREHAAGKLGQEPIYHIVEGKNEFFVATNKNLYTLNQQTGLSNKVFTMGLGDFTREDVVDHLKGPMIRAIDYAKDQVVVATSNGIYIHGMSDEDVHWQRLPSNGLPLAHATSMRIFENMSARGEHCQDALTSCLAIVVGTEKGIFLLENGQWQSIYQGMETSLINDFVMDRRGMLYAATDRGVFYLDIGEALSFYEVVERSEVRGRDEEVRGLEIGGKEKMFGYQRLKELEPSIQEVHRLAIDYADVDPLKIQAWRKRAKKKALFPALDVGFDAANDWTTSDSLWGSYSSGGQHHVGPDDKTFDKNIGWDVSLSWDLSDFVWSTDQTTIDSRSKLMVELREDILDQVTRLYFERRRVQLELLEENLNGQIEKRMRVEELTALIDGFTGGAFSRAIEAKSSGSGHVARGSGLERKGE